MRICFSLLQGHLLLSDQCMYTDLIYAVILAACCLDVYFAITTISHLKTDDSLINSNLLGF